MSISRVMSQSLISASSSMKVARIQNGIKKQMEDRAGVLEAEIKQENGNAPEKKKELEKTERKAARVEGSAMDTLSAITSVLSHAAETDQETAREEKVLEEKKEEKATEKKAQVERQEKSTNALVDVVADGITPSTRIRESLGINVDVNA